MSLALPLALLCWLAPPSASLELGAGPAGPGLTFTFPATALRIDTGLWFERGEPMAFAADGEWTMWADHFGLSNALGHRYRVGLFGWGCLMGRVGGGAEFAIGTGRTLAADASGPLQLYPNLGALGMPAGAGQLQVTVRGGRPEEAVIGRLSATGRTVVVSAAADDTASDLWVNEGDEIRLDAFGQWQMFEDGPQVGPDGDIRRRLRDGYAWGQLVARLGGTDFASGPVYRIGSQATLRAKSSGLLHLLPDTGQYAGHQRAGSLRVVVRGARPATDEQLHLANIEATDRERRRAFLRLAQYRRELVLPLAASDPALMVAAQAQADYLAALPSHECASYTAAHRVQGFGGQLRDELVHGYTDGVEAIDGLWLTVRGRRALADSRATAVGLGVARGACVVLTGSLPFEGRLPMMAVWPADGATAVPGVWNGLEEPPELPAELPPPFGTTISLTVPGGLDQVVRAELRDRLGRPMVVHVVPPPADGETVVMVPVVRLTPLETYNVEVEVVSAGQARTVSWRFSCGQPEGAPMAEPRLDDPANPAIDLGRPDQAEPSPTRP